MRNKLCNMKEHINRESAKIKVKKALNFNSTDQRVDELNISQHTQEIEQDLLEFFKKGQ